MTVCQACGAELPEEARFCSGCGARVAASAALPEERKTVTTLICDLVGFTALSEAADPEDVDRLLGEYSSRATRAIESHGGTVEKFIGDAVVGVFGVPSVHEDDPERGVRAALRLLEALDGLSRPDGTPLEARCGVNTGEALVRLDVDPSSGRGFLAGDAVNTAARLQAAAPPGAVAVGPLTHELTRRAVVYEELSPVVAKGKTGPVPAWRALRPVARTGTDADQARLTPLVGREAELAFLRALLGKATSSATPQFALLLGEPGIGKTRLVQELRCEVEARPELVTWRQGHCLPYGDDVTFWALAEIVKAHAGIRDSDGTAGVEAKLDAVLPDGEDRPWMRGRLRALLGLDAPGAGRQENHTAWLRFLEDMAATHAAVVVFEDLHWADQALLAFIEHLATHATGVPLLVVATARPELLEAHPGFAATTTTLNRLSIDPLAPGETQRLVTGLLGEAEALGGAVADIVATCEGNPFFAEQSARLVVDQARRSPVPESVQAVLAARLDALPPEQKAVLGDAAVVGSVFWDGAVAEMGRRDRGELAATLQELVGKHLVRRVRSSSMAGENEFAFAHALAREVAYQELPRAVRAVRHRDAAAWIESKAGDRIEDFSEIMAHHCSTALGLARAVADEDLADSLVGPAMRCLELAGDRALRLDVNAAERHYAAALEVAGTGASERARLLVKWARTLTRLGRRVEAVGAFDEAIALLRAGGDDRGAAVAQMGLARAVPDDLDESYVRIADAAIAQLEADGPSPELVRALSEWLWLLAGDVSTERLLLAADRAIRMSAELGLSLDAGLVAARGCARCDLGDDGAVEDLRRALELCRATGDSETMSVVFIMVANWIYLCEGFRATLAVAREGLAVARRRGDVEAEVQLRTQIGWASGYGGEWETVLGDARELQPLSDATGDMWCRIYVRCFPTFILAKMGRADEAVALVEWLEDTAVRFSGNAWTVAGVHTALAAAYSAGGDLESAAAHLTGAEEAFRGPGGCWTAEFVPETVRLALALGDRRLAAGLAGSVEPLQPLTRLAVATAGALLREACGEYEAALEAFTAAAAGWREFAGVYEEAHALCGRGRCLMALGRAAEAAAALAAARGIFRRLGARPALSETDEWLAKAGAVA